MVTHANLVAQIRLISMRSTEVGKRKKESIKGQPGMKCGVIERVTD